MTLGDGYVGNLVPSARFKISLSSLPLFYFYFFLPSLFIHHVVVSCGPVGIQKSSTIVWNGIQHRFIYLGINSQKE